MVEVRLLLHCFWPYSENADLFKYKLWLSNGCYRRFKFIAIAYMHRSTSKEWTKLINRAKIWKLKL